MALPVLVGMLFFVPWRLTAHAGLPPSQLRRQDAGGAAYHINQSLIAVGTGGLTGRGYMEGDAEALLSSPRPHTDFIFANIAEELGFIGAIIILAALRHLRLSRPAHGLPLARTPSPASSPSASPQRIVLQAFFNISVVLSLLPTKGIPLAADLLRRNFAVFTLASIGILLNISKKTE